jgi:hypothetical protein
MSRVCSVDGCGSEKKITRGFCSAHYQRVCRHGDPLAGGTPKGSPHTFLEMAKEYFGDECLMWPYGPYGDDDRRPRMRIFGNIAFVSRIICEHANGAPPSERMEAAHSCGRGRDGCVTRKHLRWATPLENHRDMALHGTLRRGEMQPHAKLCDADVIEIRNLWPRCRQSVLAKKFVVDQSTISLIVNRKLWTHVK